MGGSAFGSFLGDKNGRLASMMQKPGLGGGGPTFGGGSPAYGGGKNPFMPMRGRPIDSPSYGGGMANDHGPAWNKGPMGGFGAPDIGMMPGRGNEGQFPGMGMAGQREPWAMGGAGGPEPTPMLRPHFAGGGMQPMGQFNGFNGMAGSSGGMGGQREPWAMGGGMGPNAHGPAWNKGPMGGFGTPDIGMMPGRGNEGMVPANPGMGGGMGMNRPGTPNREPWAMGGGGMTAGGQFPAYNPMPVGGRPMGRGGILGSWR